MNSFNNADGPGYVYVVRWGENLYKIGITKNIEGRFQQLKVGEKLVPIWWGFFEKRRAVEYEMHKTLERYRLPQSEYFELDRKQVDSLLADLKTRTMQEAGDRYKELIPEEFRPGYVPTQGRSAQEEPEREPEQFLEPELEQVAELRAAAVEARPGVWQVKAEPEPELRDFEKRVEKRVAEILAERRQQKSMPMPEPVREVERSWEKKLAGWWKEFTTPQPQPPLRRQRTMSYGEWFCSRYSGCLKYSDPSAYQMYQRWVRQMRSD